MTLTEDQATREGVAMESTTSVLWWTCWLESTIGSKSEEKQEEEDTRAGANFKAIIIEEDTFVAFYIFGFLVKYRTSTKIGKGENHQVKSSSACEVWKCTNTNLGTCNVRK